MLEVSMFDFDLPEELIAQTPLENRATSRLMVLNPRHHKMEHKHFSDIIDYLNPGDCLVLNDTRVLPARLIGLKKETGAQIELLLLKQIEGDTWECLVKPSKRVKAGTRIEFGDGALYAVCEKTMDEGRQLLTFHYSGVFYEVLEELGKMPLPPYIKESLPDQNRYQTVYAKHRGSAAAPTAGLHFTDQLLEKIKEKGVKIAFITLHVGLGTFRPVKVDRLEDHTMHAEFYQMSEETSEMINKTKESGGKVVAVGTTVIRTLETIAANNEGSMNASSGWTDIFIYPGFQYKAVDGIITNFHLPKSTLIMLVSAFAGKDFIMTAYKKAVDEQYRFFSFGDAMLITEGIS